MHVAQLNLVPLPPQVAPHDAFAHWPSLADIAEAVASAGVRVSVVQAATRPARIMRQGVDYHFVDLAGGGRVRGRQLAALLERLGADVAHVHGLDFAGAAAALARRAPMLPVLLQDHANGVPRHCWSHWRWRRRYAAAAGIAFTSLEMAAPFQRARLFAPATRLFEIPESSSRFAPGDRDRARAETGVHGDPALLWVGHLAPGKDPMTVLDAVAAASGRLPGLQLWCVFGSAPLGEAVRGRIAADPRLAGRVHLLGAVAHARVETLMRAADLFVSASLGEGCGYAAVEAYACGTWPLLSDIPAFRSLSAGGRVGTLYPCGDACALAAELVRLGGNRSAAAQVRAHFDAHLSFAAVGRRWDGAYRALRAATGVR